MVNVWHRPLEVCVLIHNKYDRGSNSLHQDSFFRQFYIRLLKWSPWDLENYLINNGVRVTCIFPVFGIPESLWPPASFRYGLGSFCRMKKQVLEKWSVTERSHTEEQQGSCMSGKRLRLTGVKAWGGSFKEITAFFCVFFSKPGNLATKYCQSEH